MIKRDPNYSSLIEAIQSGQIEHVHQIIDRYKGKLIKSYEGETSLLNFKPHPQDSDYIAPLFQAIKNDQPDIVKYLIESGAEIDFRQFSGQTPLFYAYRIKKPQIAEFERGHVGF